MLRRALQVMAAYLAVVVVGLVGAALYLLDHGPPDSRPEVFLQLGHTNEVRHIAFSPDGKSLASAGADQTVKLWDVRTGALRATLFGHTDAVLSIAFSPDGKTLASAGEDQTIKLWDASTGNLRATLSGHTFSVYGVTFSPDGNILASASGDRTIKLWDARTGSLRTTLFEHTDAVWGVAFSPDGKSLASASEDQTIKLWDPGTGELKATLSGHIVAVLAVAFSRDGKVLASASEDQTVRLWDVNTGATRATLRGHTDAVFGVAFSPDGKSLASASGDRTIKLWDAETGALRATLPGHTVAVRDVAFSPDGKSLASGSGDRTIKLWDAGTATLRTTLPGHTDAAWAVAASPDGESLALGSVNQTVKLWEADTGVLRATLSGHTEAVLGVAFSPDGKGLASASRDKTVRLWDARTGALRATLSKHTDAVWGAAFSPDGKSLASASADQTVKLWDVDTGALRATLLGHTDEVLGVAFSPDGESVASASRDQTIRLWDVHTGILRAVLSKHTDAVWGVAFSPDGNSLASASRDQTIKLWDVRTRVLQNTLSGHTDAVWSVAFAPDGKSLASASRDQTIKLWDAHTGALQATLSGHPGGVSGVAYSPNGRHLVACGYEMSIWDVDTKHAVLKMVAQEGGRFLTLYPGSLWYRSSSVQGEPEPAAVRFDERLDNAYPLHYYRGALLIPPGPATPTSLPPVQIRPMPIRQAWDQFGDKLAWVSGGGAVYLALVVTTLMMWRRTDPLEIAKAFFSKANLYATRQQGGNVLRLSGVGQTPSLAVFFDGERSAIAASVRPFNTPGEASRKLYVIYAAQAPSSEQLVRLRQMAGDAQIIALSSRDMARALADGSASPECLRRMEEPFVARIDPYDEQRPVESELMFFGRGRALEDIPQALLQGQHVGLFGLRKIGKTSLLNRVRDRLSLAPCVWIDCQGFEAVAMDLFNAILDGLHMELNRLAAKRVPTPAVVASPGEFRQAFLACVNSWRAHSAGGRVVVLLDEVDKYFPDRRDAANEATLREYVVIFRMLRALAQEHRCLAVMAVAYRPDINRSNLLSTRVGENPMFMSYQEHFLGFLNEVDTMSMLRELGRWQSIEWEEGALEQVFILTGGHPLLARQVASDACARGRHKKVALADVVAVGNEILSSFSRHRVGRYIDESIWQLLRGDEQIVLSRVVLSTTAASSIEHERMDALANLQHFGVIDDHSGVLRVRGALLQSWLQRNGVYP